LLMGAKLGQLENGINAGCQRKWNLWGELQNTDSKITKLICGLWGGRHIVHIVHFQLMQDTSWQQLGWILPDTVNTVNRSWWWAKTSPETCRAD
jgi:hypothetical protein